MDLWSPSAAEPIDVIFLHTGRVVERLCVSGAILLHDIGLWLVGPNTDLLQFKGVAHAVAISKYRWGRGGASNGDFIPFAAFQRPAASFRRAASPLLEEEGYLRLNALIADADDPVRVHRPCARTAFTTNDDPVDTFQIQFADGRNQRARSTENEWRPSRFGGEKFVTPPARFQPRLRTTYAWVLYDSRIAR